MSKVPPVFKVDIIEVQKLKLIGVVLLCTTMNVDLWVSQINCR